MDCLRHAIPLVGLIPSAAVAQEPPSLMPLPASVEYQAGRLRLDSTFTATTSGFTEDRLRHAVGRALGRIAGVIGQPLARLPGSGGQLIVQIGGAGQRVQSVDEDESYALDITPTEARLTAPTTVGAIRGLETVVQLVSADAAGFYLPVARIADRPRFPWRGLLVDASRHFMPVDMLERTLDGMALVKLNVLHWHLSDDQGFRLESRRYPRLQELGSDGRYYTQAQVREIVAYARDRGIRVVPEFDMPGHSTSWLVAYPEYGSAPGPYEIERRFGVFDAAFDPTREEVYRFIDGFIAEMAPLFPDPYWHIGGDEVSGVHWNRNPRILRFKREHGFRDNEALQAYFNQRLSTILTRYGKRMVGWDEILHDGLPANTVVQSWRGSEYLGKAASLGFAGILSAPWYLDHIDPAEQHYLADPLPPEAGLTAEQAARVFGGEACMWAEHVDSTTVDSRIWPRLAAIAERFWSPAAVRDVESMYRRLAVVSIQLERVGLGHEAHTYRMLRELTGRRGIQPLHDLLSATMPATFSQRSRLQAPTQFTPLTHLVDAARPDPWARFQLHRLAAEVTRNRAAAAAEQLRRIFLSWQTLPAATRALADSIPLAAEGVAAADGLARLGGLGAQALDRRGNGGIPPAWRDSVGPELDTLAGPFGLLRLAGVEAVRTLVDSSP